MAEDKMEKIISWAKRRGFIFPSSEIYGGIGGIYDWGQYGVTLKNNFKRLWWKKFVEERDDVLGIDSSIIMNQKVWEASGHTGSGFTDPLRECKKCHHRFRADEIEGDKNKCPDCGGELTEEKKFNILVKTHLGPVEDESTLTYLRGETAQGMFVNFKQILETSRKKIPFGIAQVGKSFRNEITPKNFIFRTREFEIAEIEYFVKPPSTSSGRGGEDEKAFNEWFTLWKEFYQDLGLKKENMVDYEHPKEGLAHYSKRTVDINYKFPFGEKELAGVANRTDFDLSQHEKFSGKDLKYFDQESGEKYIPYVIEPTLGVERALLALICDAFEEVGGGRGEESQRPAESGQQNQEAASEIVLHIDPRLAPVKVAVLPLVKKLSSKAKEIYEDIRKCYPAEFDESGSIGRRYRRQDEIGTPYCITVDFDTEKDESVTIRNRDTMKQERIKIEEINNFLFEKVM